MVCRHWSVLKLSSNSSQKLIHLPKLILFFNANTRFHKPVHLKDVLPDESQSLVGVQHPGFDGLHPLLCPFERRKRPTCSSHGLTANLIFRAVYSVTF